MRVNKKLIFTLTFILAYLIINLIIAKPTKAVSQIVSTDIDGISETKYPGIKQMVQNLKNEHPNWKFKILYTGLEWKEVIEYEYMGHEGSPKNLVPATTKCLGDWVCLSCGTDRYYDKGSWRCASETAIQYMMDARNSINSSDIFQFMELTYQEASYESIQKMVSGSFLDNSSYINTIITAGRNYNVSPYYIVALATQEQGRGGSSTISGNYPGYQGYYNIFNINASGNGSDTIIRNALQYAKDNGWDTLEKSIEGGVARISSSYIAKGQNTLYFQKFDVENSDGKLYWHQYQQNILAAQNEGVSIRKTFEEINSVEAGYTFIIPVYENTPVVYQTKPSTTRTINTLITDLVRVNVRENIALRTSPGGSIAGTKLYANEIVTRLEQATNKVNGTYWDKVMKADGTIAYVARETYDYESEYKLYLIPVAERNTNFPPVSENQPSVPTIPDNDTSGEVKIDEEQKTGTLTPGTTFEQLKEKMGDDVTVKDKNGEVVSSGKLATGYVINDTYTVVVLGDINGDGKIDTIDAARTLKASVGNYDLQGIYFSASDINNDGEINTIDAARLLKASVGNYGIHLQERGE